MSRFVQGGADPATGGNWFEDKVKVNLDSIKNKCTFQEEPIIYVSRSYLRKVVDYVANRYGDLSELLRKSK